MSDKKEPKFIYSFKKEELAELKFLDLLVPRIEGWASGLKNEFSMRVAAEMKRCGVNPDDILKEGKRISLNLDKGEFEIVTPDKTPKKIEIPKEEPKLEVAK